MTETDSTTDAASGLAWTRALEAAIHNLSIAIAQVNTAMARLPKSSKQSPAEKLLAEKYGVIQVRLEEALRASQATRVVGDLVQAFLELQRQEAPQEGP